MTTRAKSGHPASSLSAVELMTVLFFDGFLRYDLTHPKNSNNDRVIFSKGHASPLLYALYAAAGKISPRTLQTLREFGSPLEGQIWGLVRLTAYYKFNNPVAIIDVYRLSVQQK